MPNGMKLSGGVTIKDIFMSPFPIRPVNRHDNTGAKLCRVKHEGNKPIRLQPVIGSEQVEPLQSAGRLPVKDMTSHAIKPLVPDQLVSGTPHFTSFLSWDLWKVNLGKLINLAEQGG